jgi:hypothetical protein
MLRLSCFFLLLFSLSGCLVVPQPTETILPSPSPLPTHTEIPTSTVVWFPPTVTYTPFPTSTFAPPTPEQRLGLGDIIFEDDFTDATIWALSRTQNTSAALGKGVLTLAIQETKAYVSSTRNQPVLGNFYAEVTITPSLCRGQDEYGLLIRQASSGDFYRFSLSCEGEVRLDRVLAGQASTPYPWEPGGSFGVARLGVWAVGKEMRFFVNDLYQFTYTDPSISSGLIGVFARSTGNNAVTVNFSNLVVREVNP